MSKQKPKDATRAAPRAARRTSPPRIRLVVSDAPYEVGYGRPPVKSQFKPGQSGNPSGRPKGAKNKTSTEIEKIKNAYRKIAGERITIRKGDKPARMSKMDYILLATFDKAAKGDAGMTKLVLKLGLTIEQEDKRQRDSFLEEAIGYKKEWSDEFMYRGMKGIRGLPEPIPHPDHVIIGRDGTVSIVGPMTPEEKKEDDEIEALRTVWKADLVELNARRVALEAKLKDRRCYPHRAQRELVKVYEEISVWEGLLAATSREARYGSK